MLVFRRGKKRISPCVCEHEGGDSGERRTPTDVMLSRGGNSRFFSSLISIP